MEYHYHLIEFPEKSYILKTELHMKTHKNVFQMKIETQLESYSKEGKEIKPRKRKWFAKNISTMETLSVPDNSKIILMRKGGSKRK